MTVALALDGVPPTTVVEGHRDRGLLVLLGGVIVALLLIPDRYALGLGVGLRPHQLLALVLAGLLLARFAQGRPLAIGRPACVAFVLVVVAVASIVSNVERLRETTFDGALRVTLTLGCYVAVAASVAAIATSARRRRVILGLLVSLVAVSCLFAIHEATTAQPIRLNPTPPGLVEQQNASGAASDVVPSAIVRNGVTRPAGLAANPLELSAVMSITLPFAVYLALSASRWRGRIWFLTCSLLIAVGVVLSISRTGVLACAAMLGVALIANIRRPRLLVAGLVAVAALAVTVSRLVPDSVDSLVQQVGKDGATDPSLATRLQDYQELDNLLGPHPWLGQGPNSITAYVSRDSTGMILDNMYLLTIAETGVLGLLALIAVLVSTAATAAQRARREAAERGLFVAIVCATAGFALMCMTFDALRFTQVSTIFMVAVGLASAGVLSSSPARDLAGAAG